MNYLVGTTAKLTATFFGLGYWPWGPGTLGSLGAIGLLALCREANPAFFPGGPGHLLPMAAVALLLFGAGLWSSNYLQRVWGKDPSRVVIDEALGMWIAMSWLPFDWGYMIFAFLLFRFFDIAKPLGIRQLERLPGGLGIMMDDLLAGLYTNLILQAVFYSGLLAQPL